MHMNIHKKISPKIAIIIIGACVVVGFVVSLFTVSKCRYTQNSRNPNVLTFNPEPAGKVTACYFKWQCQLIEDEQGRKICDAKFDHQ